VHYLFDDVFYNFRFFFNPQKNKDSKFLRDIAFGLKPRAFSDNENEDSVIYDEEAEVLEMYFILVGTVGVGFHKYQQPLLEGDQFELTFDLRENSFFGDYYLCNNLKAEFVYMATSQVQALALSKKFLMRRIFPKYPTIYRDIKADSHYRYHSWMREGIMKHKYAHVEMVNKKSTYNSINLKNKYVANVASN
jgi:hypothetical protein